jgi:coenzyme F420-reducing hydrogenase beta subunit
METVCEKDKCVGCGACSAVCPRNAIQYEESFFACNAFKNEKCINCHRCIQVCQQINPPELKEPIYWYQGWNLQTDIRERSTSGGIATGIAEEFIRVGGEAVLCGFGHGQLQYSLVDEPTEVEKYAGSKYIKSSMTDVYRIVEQRLNFGKKVLFIGLPCQVASLKNYINNTKQTNLYTIDLICHGTPSIQTFDLFIRDALGPQYDIRRIDDIRFRGKNGYHIFLNGKSLVNERLLDRYTIAFINGLSYTENCYSCRYAQINRVSDLTLGDSWGSELPSSEKKKGISLMLCQTEKGKGLLSLGQIERRYVDIEKAISFNHQLKYPTPPNKNRKKYIKVLSRNGTFSKAVFKALPWTCFRQDAKKFLIDVGLLK